MSQHADSQHTDTSQDQDLSSDRPAQRQGSHWAQETSSLEEPTKQGRSTRDKVVIAVLAVVLVALLVGVVWGVRYLVTAIGAERQDAQEMAEREIPATPDELAASSTADEPSVATESQGADAAQIQGTSAEAAGAGDDAAGEGAGQAEADGGTVAPAADAGEPAAQGANPAAEPAGAVGGNAQAADAANQAAGEVEPVAADADAQALEPQTADGADAQTLEPQAAEAEPAAQDLAGAADVADPAVEQPAVTQEDPAAAQAEDSAVDPAAQAATSDSVAADPVVADPTAVTADPAAQTSTDGTVSAGSSLVDGVAASSLLDGASSSAVADANLPDNPIDFATLQEDNTDIYAWLYIPNTGINLPVLQSPFDDEYYLSHDPDRNEDVYGSVFSQLANSKDFTDPVTVLYGHDGEGQFKNLHYFEDEEFFAQNEEIYVYTPGHILTYRVVAAYKYDNRHILNSFDFADPAVLQQYYDAVLNPDSLVLNVREGATLDATTDKILQLSTCMLDEFHGSSRYIVTGVLIDDQLTK